MKSLLVRLAVGSTGPVLILLLAGSVFAQTSLDKQFPEHEWIKPMPYGGWAHVNAKKRKKKTIPAAWVEPSSCSCIPDRPRPQHKKRQTCDEPGAAPTLK